MKTLLTLLLSFLTITAFAQRKFVHGYYVTKQGERVEAQINDQNWDRNPTFIEVSQGNDVIRFDVNELTAFGLSTGDVFYSYTVEVDKSPTKLNDIIPNSQPVLARETVFLRAIVNGAASLYYLKDDNAKEHFFIQKGEEEPAELIYRTVKYESNGKLGLTKQPIYRGLLASKLTDCTKGIEGVAKLQFTQKALKGLVENYNICVSGSKGTYLSVEEKISWTVAASGAMAYTSLSFKGGESKALTNSDFSSLHYMAGVSALATLPRGAEKWALQGDLTYRPFKAEGEYTESSFSSSNNYTRTTTTFDMGYIGLNASVRYRLTNTKVKPFLSAGIANNLLVSDNSTQIVFTRFHNSENTKERKPLEETRKLEQAVVFGLGTEMKKLAAELKMEKSNGISPYLGLKSGRHTFSFVLSYTLL